MTIKSISLILYFPTCSGPSPLIEYQKFPFRNNTFCNKIDELKDYLLSETSQKEKDKYHMIPLICGI